MKKEKEKRKRNENKIKFKIKINHLKPLWMKELYSLKLKE